MNENPDPINRAVEEGRWNLGSSKLRQIPISIDEGRFILREADESAKIEYRTKATSGFKYKRDGDKLIPESISGAGIHEAESTLISKCLFKEVGHGEEYDIQPVSIQLVKKMPTRITSKMYDWILDNSDLREKPTKEVLLKQIQDNEKLLKQMEEEEAKNENGRAVTE